MRLIRCGFPVFLSKKVVHPAGLEPTTYCSGGSRSIQMSYGCILSGVNLFAGKPWRTRWGASLRRDGIMPPVPVSLAGNDIR